MFLSLQELHRFCLLCSRLCWQLVKSRKAPIVFHWIMYTLQWVFFILSRTELSLHQLPEMVWYSCLCDCVNCVYCSMRWGKGFLEMWIYASTIPKTSHHPYLDPFRSVTSEMTCTYAAGCVLVQLPTVVPVRWVEKIYPPDGEETVRRGSMQFLSLNSQSPPSDAMKRKCVC